MDAQDGSDPNKGELLGYLLEVLTAGLDPRESRKRGESALRELAETALPLFESLCAGRLEVRVWNPQDHRKGRTVLELVTRDQPFLVDTFRLAMRRLGLREKFLLHAVLGVERGVDGQITALGKRADDAARETYLYAETTLVTSKSQSLDLADELEQTFIDLSHIVEDHDLMVEALSSHVAQIESSRHVPLETQFAEEVTSFLDWLADDNFVFFGYRYYETDRYEGAWQLQLDSRSGLGLLRDRRESRFGEIVRGEEIPTIIRSRFGDPKLVFFDKSWRESRIHRSGRLDCISIKSVDAEGRLVGFARFVGLLTFKGVRTRGSSIPILRRRRDRVLERIEGAAPGSHTYKAAIEAYDSLPVEFLFAFDNTVVTNVVQKIVRTLRNPEVGVCVVPDPLNRSFFLSVILPRRLYDEGLRSDLKEMLRESYSATYVDDRTSFLDEEVALIHFFCSTENDLDVDMLVELEKDTSRRAIGWDDRFEAALLEHFSENQAYRLASQYLPRLPREYRVVTSPDEALLDLKAIESIRNGDQKIDLRLAPDVEDADGCTQRLKIYQAERPYLTDLLPALDNMGLRVIDAHLTQVGQTLWIVGFRIERISEDQKLVQRLLKGLHATLCGLAEDGPLNRLILGVGLRWSEVELVRTYLAYARQLGSGLERLFVSTSLLNHPGATRGLVRWFRARFDPDLEGDRAMAQAQALEQLNARREEIQTADEDRVFAMIANLIQNTLRTNFFSCDLESSEAIAIKVDARAVEGMPAPKPHAEIFVHSPEMMGSHLRGGTIARGGIRWSDRVEDFRTEILGLMKTQMVKNGLIVPTGAKGGFVLKKRPDDPIELREHADLQYSCFMRALLSITDNVVNSRVVTPERVVRHDGDDPYLVVAADKGTAHLSDQANSVAEEVGFWLGDAFASGGSDGYDHKKEGITARGAWVCVRRHFVELGHDIEREGFKMVGIGDMGGDVFGNGLVLARKAQLQAAFNHLHIFLDPKPDAEAAWHERKRLFELPRSSWRDYDETKISEGGGVYDRSARAIHVSEPVKEMLGLERDVLSGQELVRAVLCMPTDLLWNGGIGTYVRASWEPDDLVGDRSNASVRVTADQLRARVIGEGGNLGLTQLSRIEFALRGGRINTDAVDNSAGVDLSDHEVNIKVLLSAPYRQGKMSKQQRDSVMVSCVGEVTAASVRHNETQSRCLSLDQLRCERDPERMKLVSGYLSEHADLDNALEFLPDREELRRRSEKGSVAYTRPELAILLGYTKLLAKKELAGSDLPNRACYREQLDEYFPHALREQFSEQISMHPLRSEITATELTNRVIDRAGVTLIPEMVWAFGARVTDVISSYCTVEALLEAERFYRTLDSQAVSEAARLEGALWVEEAMRAGTFVYLALERDSCLEDRARASWLENVRELHQLLSDAGSADESLLANLRNLGLDPELADSIERLQRVARGLGAVSMALRSDQQLAEVVEVYAWLGRESRADWVLERLWGLAENGSWRKTASEALSVEVLNAQRNQTEKLLRCGRADALEDFRVRNGSRLRQIELTVRQIEAESQSRLPLLTILAQQIRRLG